MRGCRVSIASVLPLFFGLTFLAIGLGLAVFGSRQASAEAARAEQLPPLSAAALDDSQPGRAALIEGRISARNPPLFQAFVAYVRQEYRGTRDDKEEWVQDERRTPPLRIDLADGLVALANDQYTIERAPHSWQTEGGLVWDGFTGEGTKYYAGFQAGDPILAIGTLVPGREGLEMQADLVYGGTRADYIADRRSAAGLLPLLGAPFALLGAIATGIGLWQLKRKRR